MSAGRGNGLAESGSAQDRDLQSVGVVLGSNNLRDSAPASGCIQSPAFPLDTRRSATSGATYKGRPRPLSLGQPTPRATT